MARTSLNECVYSSSPEKLRLFSEWLIAQQVEQVVGSVSPISLLEARQLVKKLKRPSDHSIIA